MEKVFVDWGRAKPHKFVLEEQIDVQETDDLSIFEGNEIYMEHGCPYGILLPALEKNTIYLCAGKLIKDLRKEKEKTDDYDPILIRQLALSTPDAFTQINEKSKQQLMYEFDVKQYKRITKDLAAIKNKHKSFIKEFGIPCQEYEELMSRFKDKQKQLLKKIKPRIKKHLETIKAQGIKGAGIVMICQLLCFAHPRKFDTLSKYLSYCGYKQSTWGKGFTYKERNSNGASFKYNRNVKYVMYNIVDNLIMKKDETYYPLYLKIKERFMNEEFKKVQAHGKSRNRVATFFLKTFYELFKDDPEWLE